MEKISLYLKKFEVLGRDGADIRNACREAVAEILGVKIPGRSIVVRDGGVFFSVPPSVRSELFMRKEKLRALILKKLPGGRIGPIR